MYAVLSVMKASAPIVQLTQAETKRPLKLVDKKKK
jgi:hypothetical protein